MSGTRRYDYVIGPQSQAGTYSKELLLPARFCSDQSSVVRCLIDVSNLSRCYPLICLSALGNSADHWVAQSVCNFCSTGFADRCSELRQLETA